MRQNNTVIWLLTTSYLKPNYLKTRNQKRKISSILLRGDHNSSLCKKLPLTEVRPF